MSATGTQISDMTVTASPLPAGTYTPIAVTDPLTGLSTQVSYRYDLGTDLLTRVSYTALAASGGSALVGFINSGTGATARTAQAKLRDTASVQDFGALGNGSADDTAAFTNALATGKEIFAPPGTYLVSSTTIGVAGTRLKGAGSGTVIRSTDATKNTIIVSADDVEISDLRMEGCATSAASPKFAIFTDISAPALRLGIERVIFSGASSGVGFTSAIKYDNGCHHGRVRDCWIERLWGTASSYGYGVLAGAVTGLIIEGNVGIAPASRGRHFVYLSAGALKCKADLNYTSGWYESPFAVFATDLQTACDGNIITHNTIDAPASIAALTSGGIGIYQNSVNTLVEGNIIVGSLSCGIKQDGDSSVLFKNNRVVGNTVVNSAFVGIDAIALQGGDISTNDVRNSSQVGTGSWPNIRLVSDGVTGTSAILVTGNRSTDTTGKTRSSFQLSSTSPAPSGIIVKGNSFPALFSAGVELNGVSCAIDGFLTVTQTWDPASVADKASLRLTGITLTGAAVGDTCLASHTQSLAGCTLAGSIYATSTADAVLSNLTGGAVDLASGTLKIESHVATAF